LRVRLDVLHARGNFIFTLFMKTEGSSETSVTTYYTTQKITITVGFERLGTEC